MRSVCSTRGEQSVTSPYLTDAPRAPQRSDGSQDAAPIDRIDCAARADPLTLPSQLLDLCAVIDSEASPTGRYHMPAHAGRNTTVRGTRTAFRR